VRGCHYKKKPSFLAALRLKNGIKRFELFIFFSRFQNGSTYGVLKSGLSHLTTMAQTSLSRFGPK
jgi:hypothetical protein